MTFKNLLTKKFLVGTALGAMLSVTIITGCTFDAGFAHSPDPDSVTVSQEISEREGGESAGEHGGGREGSGADISATVRQGVADRENGDSEGEHIDRSEDKESRKEGSGNGGEHGSSAEGSGDENGGESHNEGSGGEINEAAMSSPIIPLDQAWDGALGGLAISAQYDAATQSVNSAVQNMTSQQLCYVQAEPHLKSGTQTVGELGPEKLGDLNPGQTATTNLSVASEPSLAGVSYDGYVVHMEVFDCAGSGPVPHVGGEGSEPGSGESGSEHGGGESGGEGDESGGGSEEGSGATLALDETFDEVRGGARLILNYDAPSNSFKGFVQNTTNSVLTDVRIEVHLSNGTELGPTTSIDMPPGAVAVVNMPATQEAFTGWIAHAEVGSGGGGGEHSSGGRESGGEHGGKESGGEHGGRGERRGGG